MAIRQQKLIAKSAAKPGLTVGTAQQIVNNKTNQARQQRGKVKAALGNATNQNGRKILPMPGSIGSTPLIGAKPGQVPKPSAPSPAKQQQTPANRPSPAAAVGWKPATGAPAATPPATKPMKVEGYKGPGEWFRSPWGATGWGFVNKQGNVDWTAKGPATNQRVIANPFANKPGAGAAPGAAPPVGGAAPGGAAPGTPGANLQDPAFMAALNQAMMTAWAPYSQIAGQMSALATPQATAWGQAMTPYDAALRTNQQTYDGNLMGLAGGLAGNGFVGASGMMSNGTGQLGAQMFQANTQANQQLGPMALAALQQRMNNEVMMPFGMDVYNALQTSFGSQVGALPGFQYAGVAA